MPVPKPLGERARLRATLGMMSLTPRTYEVLRIMREQRDHEDGELIYERGRGFLGEEPVAARIVMRLIRNMSISLAQDSTLGGFERYTINETGLKLLAEVERRLAASAERVAS